jgi:AraC-like DNA-binding protein
MYQCGTEKCEPGHAYGPAVRDHYLIHYILDGKGVFQARGLTYRLHKGQGFLICPGEITYYEADTEYSWHYSWVGFHRIKAESCLIQASLTADNPVFTYEKDAFIKDCFKEMMATGSYVKGREFRLLGLLYMFLSQLIETNGKERFPGYTSDKKELYVKKAVEFMEMNYSRKISVAELAGNVGLDRSYFGALFKERLNISPQEYLINLRVNKACELMDNNSLSIGDISRSVGYEDPLLFSKVFRRIKSCPPREYRKKYKI